MSRSMLSEESNRARQPIPLDAVDIVDGFWDERRRINREVTLQNQLEKLDGRIDNLLRAGGQKEGGFEGPYHNDPPVYKWVEAACYVLANNDDPELRAEINRIVEIIADAQQDDGYLHSYFILEREVDERWTNLGTKHELFAVGHLIEAAIAHRRATRDDQLFEVACACADHVCNVFGPGRNTGYAGHPAVELALVRLYRETSVERYLETATFFVDQRGRRDSRFAWEIEHVDQVAGSHAESLYLDDKGEYDGRYSQDHAPVREQTTVEGHAVKATFLYAGIAEVAAETGDKSLVDALETLWANMTERRMYITGGVGSTADGEAFGEDFELSNEHAYAETCAAFGSIIWNQRLLELTGEGQFGDLIERTLYNGLLAGVSLDGTRFSYTNPLESTGEERHRQPWYHTSCCPPNVARLLASLERYIYSTTDRTLAVDQFIGSRVELEIDGVPITVCQETDYPWAGEVTIDVAADTPVTFDLALRVPAWCREPWLSVNGDEVVLDDPQDGYVHVHRTWETGDRVDVSLPMEVEQIEAHPDVKENRNQVALRYGPLVYCLEQVDNDAPVDLIALPSETDASASYDSELLDGIVVISGNAYIMNSPHWNHVLYRPVEDVSVETGRFTAIPYYAWDNRTPGEMRTWLRSKR